MLFTFEVYGFIHSHTFLLVLYLLDLTDYFPAFLCSVQSALAFLKCLKASVALLVECIPHSWETWDQSRPRTIVQCHSSLPQLFLAYCINSLQSNKGRKPKTNAYMEICESTTEPLCYSFDKNIYCRKQQCPIFSDVFRM